ncbi:MAG TPA: hypothetical protein PKI11_11220 [Candidatus Hydrogenedentes bacterium]|nr:hypothetical protein [Candidatus Hydrogenedentota bacterium]HNT89716.1 hypothetical protein [Candidatus Hydrogenedentota bacterium]
MPYKGHVKDGVIVFDEPVDLCDGAEVLVDIRPVQSNTDVERGPSFRERYAAVIGKAQDLPEDASYNHDHYLYGSPKR